MPALVTPPSSNPSPTWSNPDSSWDRQWSPEKYRRTPTPGFEETQPSPLPELTLLSFKKEQGECPIELNDDQLPTPDEIPKITIKTPTSPRYDPDLCIKCQKADHEFIHCPDKTKFPERICSDRTRRLNDRYHTIEGLNDLYENHYQTNDEFFDGHYDDYDDINMDK
jgi:hypothetical protein